VFTPISQNLLPKERPGDPRIGHWIFSSTEESSTSHLILGCPDDLGIKINFGRPGAALGPSEIRKAFFKMALPKLWKESSTPIRDLGDIKVEPNIKKTHQNVEKALSEKAGSSASIVVLGGGHDFAAPAFTGFASSHKKQNSLASFGLVNIDPHLDVREYESGEPHSGSPFRQLLENNILQGSHLVQFGCRQNRNSQSHFEFCQQQKVNLLTLQTIRKSEQRVTALFELWLSQLGKQTTHLGVTIDMDSCSDVVGTSAAPAIGFSTQELCEMAELAGEHAQVRYFEIAEVSPPLDPSGKTALAAAEILASFYFGKFKLEKNLKNDKKHQKMI